MIRRLIVMALSFGLTTPAFAGGIRESGNTAVQRAVSQQAVRPPVAAAAKVRRSHLWAGGIMFAVGMAVASYGFLHTTDGDYVELGDASQLSNTNVGIAGLAIAAGGGAILLLGARPGASSSRTRGDAAVGIGKRLSW